MPERSIAPEGLMALCIFQSAETSLREIHRQGRLTTELRVEPMGPAGVGTDRAGEYSYSRYLLGTV